jgi:uncharacterized protein involved in copper resistance
VETVYGNDESAFGIKVESEFVSGSYAASESQFYYAKPVSENFTGIVGARYLHLRDNDTLSAMLGFSATTVFDIDVELLTFFDDDFTEFRFEMERGFSLQPKLELVPKIELRAYSNDVEAAAVEARLIYTPMDRMGVYLGGAYIRVLQTGSDESELTALVGLSYAW